MQSRPASHKHPIQDGFDHSSKSSGPGWAGLGAEQKPGLLDPPSLTSPDTRETPMNIEEAHLDRPREAEGPRAFLDWPLVSEHAGYLWGRRLDTSVGLQVGRGGQCFA